MNIPDHLEAELREWPGAKFVGLEQGRKHCRLTLSFEGKERFIVLPSTSSCRRAEQNQIRDLRKTLVEIGATRNERRKASARRKRNKPYRPPLAHIRAAPVKENPWDALSAFAVADIPRPTLWLRLKRWFLDRIGLGAHPGLGA